MRTYLVVIDETEESETALRFAARRAAKTGGAVQVLVIIAPDSFVAFGALQDAMRQDAIDHAEEVVARAMETLGEEGSVRPVIKVESGVPAAVIRQAISDNPEIGALVLGAARSGNPGPLVNQFTGHDAGTLPCPIMVIPGGLGRDELDRLS